MRRSIIAAVVVIIIAAAVATYVYFRSVTAPRNPYSPIKGVVPANAVRFKVESPALGKWFPAKYTCVGEDVSPPIKWGPPPKGTVSYVLIMYDPDAPMGTFYHWILYNIPASVTSLPPAIPRKVFTKYGVQGVNDFGRIGYGGPCPPRGSTHRYVIAVLALNTKLKLGGLVNAAKVLNAVKGHVIGYGVLIVRFGRS